MFEVFFDFLIFLNVFILVVVNDHNKFEWIFLTAFIIELALKIYTMGFIKFISSNWNM